MTTQPSQCNEEIFKELKSLLNEGLRRGSNTNKTYNAILVLFDEVVEKTLEEAHKLEGPMGVSQWAEHGRKYGYWKYFEERRKNSESQNTKGVSWKCRFHPTDWFHEIGCPDMDWSKEQLMGALLTKKKSEVMAQNAMIEAFNKQEKRHRGELKMVIESCPGVFHCFSEHLCTFCYRIQNWKTEQMAKMVDLTPEQARIINENFHNLI